MCANPEITIIVNSRFFEKNLRFTMSTILILNYENIPEFLAFLVKEQTLYAGIRVK